MRRFDLGLYLKPMKQYQPTEAPMVPAMISAIPEVAIKQEGVSAISTVHLVWRRGRR